MEQSNETDIREILRRYFAALDTERKNRWNEVGMEAQGTRITAEENLRDWLDKELGVQSVAHPPHPETK